MILNLACGHNRIDGCINVDKFVDGADIKADILDLPFPDNSANTIFLFHTIEHFEEPKQITLLQHIWNKLRPDGRLIMSYPEFTKCAQYYIDNYKGQREFFKYTIYGRQSNPGDYHFTLMDSKFFTQLLLQLGFKDIEQSSETNEEWNTVIKCKKGQKPPTQEQIYRKTIWNIE